MAGRSANGDYARLVEAALGLVDAAEAFAPRLSTRTRIDVDTAILRFYEAECAARTALLGAEPRRLENAAAQLIEARAALAQATSEAAVDAVRRRSLALVA